MRFEKELLRWNQRKNAIPMAYINMHITKIKNKKYIGLSVANNRYCRLVKLLVCNLLNLFIYIV